MAKASVFQKAFGETFSVLDRTQKDFQFNLKTQEIGRVEYVAKGIVKVSGLPHICSEEIIIFEDKTKGLVFNLDPHAIGVVLLGKGDDIQTGQSVKSTGQVVEVPVGEGLLGRIINSLGEPLDNLGGLDAQQSWPIEQPAPAIIDRDPVITPLETGIKAIDALIPIGRGQRELILGDRQTGKTAIAIDTLLNQKGKDVICVYCAIGQRATAVAKVIAELKERGALEYTTVVFAGADDSSGLQFIAPYAATSIAEYFMRKGRDVLIVYDDLTRHARAYRELSLLLRRPPGREAYPGDIFYIHSRLLERSTHLKKELGGGSLTALPIIETQAQNISAYIPTNLISITDGQIYLSPTLFQKGFLPAIDVGKSVSRVGGKSQLPLFRKIAGKLRLFYSQFEELETFSRFSTRLDEETRKTIERGLRIREILKQTQYKPLNFAEQIAVLMNVSAGKMDGISLDKIENAEEVICQKLRVNFPELVQRIMAEESLRDDEEHKILQLSEEFQKC